MKMKFEQGDVVCEPRGDENLICRTPKQDPQKKVVIMSKKPWVKVLDGNTKINYIASTEDGRKIFAWKNDNEVK